VTTPTATINVTINDSGGKPGSSAAQACPIATPWTAIVVASADQKARARRKRPPNPPVAAGNRACGREPGVEGLIFVECWLRGMTNREATFVLAAGSVCAAACLV
jgi:hypothetical protein